MSSESLTTIVSAIDELLQEIDAEEGEVTNDQWEALTRHSDSLQDKCDGYIKFRDVLRSQIQMYKEEKERVESNIKTRKNLLKRMDKYLAYVIKANPDKKFEGKLGSIKLAKYPPRMLSDVNFVGSNLVLLQEVGFDFVKAFGDPKKAYYPIDKSAVKEKLKKGELENDKFKLEYAEGIRIK